MANTCSSLARYPGDVGLLNAQGAGTVPSPSLPSDPNAPWWGMLGAQSGGRILLPLLRPPSFEANTSPRRATTAAISLRRSQNGQRIRSKYPGGSPGHTPDVLDEGAAAATGFLVDGFFAGAFLARAEAFFRVVFLAVVFLAVVLCDFAFFDRVLTMTLR